MVFLPAERTFLLKISQTCYTDAGGVWSSRCLPGTGAKQGDCYLSVKEIEGEATSGGIVASPITLSLVFVSALTRGRCCGILGFDDAGWSSPVARRAQFRRINISVAKLILQWAAQEETPV